MCNGLKIKCDSLSILARAKIMAAWPQMSKVLAVNLESTLLFSGNNMGCRVFNGVIQNTLAKTELLYTKNAGA